MKIQKKSLSLRPYGEPRPASLHRDVELRFLYMVVPFGLLPRPSHGLGEFFVGELLNGLVALYPGVDIFGVEVVNNVVIRGGPSRRKRPFGLAGAFRTELFAYLRKARRGRRLGPAHVVALLDGP